MRSSTISSLSKSSGWQKYSLGVFVLIYALVVIQTAWIADDAYITLRTVDNFINGYGLTWNIGERVQSYTHPAWMFLLAAIYAVTREGYFTPILFSAAISIISTVLLAWKASPTRTGALFAVAALICSRAFIDYSTSGLENPLLYLEVVLFGWLFLDNQWDSRKGLYLTGLVAAAYLTRPDAFLLFLPGLIYILWTHRSKYLLRQALLGLSPAGAWLIFSIVYYGFPIPNTAYAKLGNFVPFIDLLRQGFTYLWQSFTTDPMTLGVILLVTGVLLWQLPRTRLYRQAWFLAGAWLYLGYVVCIGGDFMSGRLLAAPFLCAVFLLARLPLQKRTFAGLVLVSLFLPHAPLWSGPGYRVNDDPMKLIDRHGIADERGFYYRGTGLLRASLSQPNPTFAWADEGRRYREEQPAVATLDVIGMMGYFGGPQSYFVDRYALADPLLARLPPAPVEQWRIGHFKRNLPCGYLETLASGENRLTNHELALYYEKLRLITRGPIFDRQRLVVIWKMNTGQYGELIKNYRPNELCE